MGHSSIPVNKERGGFSPAQLSVIANGMYSIVNVHFLHISQTIGCVLYYQGDSTGWMRVILIKLRCTVIDQEHTPIEVECTVGAVYFGCVDCELILKLANH